MDIGLVWRLCWVTVTVAKDVLIRTLEILTAKWWVLLLTILFWFSSFKSIWYPTDEKLVELTNVLLLSDLELLSDLIHNRMQNFSRVHIGCNAHLHRGKKSLELSDHLDTRLDLLRLDFIFACVIVVFERVDLFNKTRETVVDLEKHAGEACVAYVLDSNSCSFWAHSLLNWRYNRLWRRVRGLWLVHCLRTSVRVDLHLIFLVLRWLVFWLIKLSDYLLDTKFEISVVVHESIVSILLVFACELANLVDLLGPVFVVSWTNFWHPNFINYITRI